MGSLVSKRDLPEATINYTPPAVPIVTTAPVQDTTEVPASEKVTSLVRKRSLPETILTSFRGVLSQNDFMPQRKSLLGE